MRRVKHVSSNVAYARGRMPVVNAPGRTSRGPSSASRSRRNRGQECSGSRPCRGELLPGEPGAIHSCEVRPAGCPTRCGATSSAAWMAIWALTVSASRWRMSSVCPVCRNCRCPDRNQNRRGRCRLGCGSNSHARNCLRRRTRPSCLPHSSPRCQRKAPRPGNRRNR